ncbi:Cytochrome P450 94C1 [Camellia lanceoleosa]|uniref:Cytochrome P450 94C1 n=1 Tax=Camellia lanceoleosa TaxID=1840588 RepID=A0ACC0I9X2_9ERIC|nr:Cytochrome P450 94C1 [Camellia lanceoleosa]
MEFGASFWYKSLPTPFCILFFSFTVSLTLFSLLLFILRLIKPWCNCEICRSYVTQSWSSKFGNLCDWYTHILRKSPTGTIHIHVLSNTITANPETSNTFSKLDLRITQKENPSLQSWVIFWVKVSSMSMAIRGSFREKLRVSS